LPVVVRRTPRAFWIALGAAALCLLLTMDDRYAGAIPDGRQMSWTAVAIVETGEIGQARGRDFTWARSGGDSVSRYGLGMSVAQLPAAWLAPSVEASFGPAASQPLFLIAPLMFVLAAAAAAGAIVLSLGGSGGAAASAILLTAIGSPLGAYAALDLSEPLQAAALTLSLAGAVAASDPAARRPRALSFLCGFAAGVAIFTKSSLAIVAPFALLPLLAGDGPLSWQRRALLAAAGMAGPLLMWAYFEVDRFGTMFASYGGERFSHPVADGLWRLIAGPNRGLLLYFPALAIAFPAAVLMLGRAGRLRTRLTAAASLGILASLLGLAAPWWAWHGVWGWGPRLLVPTIAPLAACAALGFDRWIGNHAPADRSAAGRWAVAARIALVALSVAVNLPGLLQNAAPVTMFVSSCEWPKADAVFAQTLAAYARRQEADGLHVAPDQALERIPRASSFVLYPWFIRATAVTSVDEAAKRLSTPPWAADRPDIRCAAVNSEERRVLLRRPGWSLWGRAFRPDSGAPGFQGVYDEGLLDQVVRAQQLRRGQAALALARKYVQLVPGGEGDAQVLESLRLLGRRSDAVEYLSGLSRERRSHPKINVVLALFERDSGNEAMARNLLGSVASSFPGTPAAGAPSAPLRAWAPDLHAMTTTPTDQAGSSEAISGRR
jgi:hypothetical protein